MHFVCLSVKWTDITIEHLVLFLQSFNMYEVLVAQKPETPLKIVNEFVWMVLSSSSVFFWHINIDQCVNKPEARKRYNKD